MDFREYRRSRPANLVGEALLKLLEAQPAHRRHALRAWLWRRRAYLVVTLGPELVRGALVGYPEPVRRLCAPARIFRYDDRGGGGFYPERNEIWLAAGVETYESRAQVYGSARHELFHYVCWNHPVYHADENHGFPHLLRAIAESKAIGHRYPRWVRFVESFLPGGDHANPVEFFSDIPTEMTDPSVLPPPLARYFAPLITDAPIPDDLLVHAEEVRPIPREGAALAEFQQLLVPLESGS